MDIDSMDDLKCLLTNVPDVDTSDSEFAKHCIRISDGLTNHRFTLVQLTEQLGELLVDISPDKRAKGINILSFVLECLPKDVLSEEQLKYICTFYSDRLKDHHKVIPGVIHGILCLAKNDNIPDGMATNFLTAIFHNISCQQQQYAERLNIYRIFQELLERKLNELKLMQFDFVYGVISSFDGERDPRILLEMLKWLPKFINSVELGHLLEEMFEVVACYFPIDFKAPQQDKNAVTREQLAEVLAPCLCATSKFAEFCIPLVLEKLDSDLTIAKLDSLELLRLSCKTFEPSTYHEHGTKIWAALYKEIVNFKNAEVELLALKALTAVAGRLDKTEYSKQFLTNVIDNIKGNLLPNSKLFRTSVNILMHLSKKENASKPIVSEVIPILTNTYKITTSAEEKINILEALVAFLNLCGNITKELEMVPVFCLEAVVSENEKLQNAGLLSLSVIPHVLEPQLRKALYDSLKIVLLKLEASYLRGSAITCLKKYADLYQKEIQEQVLQEMTPTSENLYMYLNTLCSIIVKPGFTESLLPTLCTYCKGKVADATVSFKCLREILEIEECNKALTSALVYKHNFISQTVDWIIGNLNQIDDGKDKLLLEDISNNFKILIGSLDPTEQNNTVEKEIGKLLPILNARRYVSLTVLNGLLLRLRVDTEMKNVLDSLLDVTLECNKEELAVQLLANILNKTNDEEARIRTLDRIYNSLNLNNPNSSDVVSWIIRALAMRNHADLSRWIDKLFDLLDQFKESASSFSILTQRNCKGLDSSSYCNISILYQQKLFNCLIERLCSDSMHHIDAFGYLIQETPYVLFQLHFNKIIKLILLCMDNCTVGSVLCSLLDMLQTAINAKETFIEENLGDILPRLLKLTEFKASMKVRIAALCSVDSFSQGYPLFKLLIYKNDVLNQLGKCLDDHKRLVRRQAAAARLNWFLIDAPV